MDFLRESGRALVENYRSVVLYMAAAALLMTGDALVQRFFIEPIAEDTPDNILGLYLVAMRIVLIALFAVADTVVFSRIGREIDKPYWRVPDDREALLRFYRLWLLLGLVNLVYLESMQRILGFGEDNPATFVFFLTYVVWVVLLHAFGTSVMFFGRIGREEAGEALSLLGRHVSPVAGLCLFAVVVAFLLQLTNDVITVTEPVFGVELAAGAALAALDGVFSCFLFAFMWLVCRYDRDHHEHDREDFDF